MKSHLFVCLILFLFIPLVANAAQEKDLKLPPLHHIVQVRPSSEISIPENFPLNKNKEIDCQTCHGIKDIETSPFDEIDKKSPDFFRNGPYPLFSDFCYSCHQQKAYKRPNIHQLLDKNGQYKKDDCKYCHLKTPDPENLDSTSEIKLRLPPEKLCFGCHLKTPHLNALNHQVIPDKKMQDTMRKAEISLNIILPLDNEKRIMCVTCHSPHQTGLINQKNPAATQVNDTDLNEGITYVEHPWNKVFQMDKDARLKQLSKEGSGIHTLKYQRINTEVLLRASAKDGTLCKSCHQFER